MCCKLLGISERGVRDGEPYAFDKPIGTWCPHATKRGCGIYPTRFRICREFQCGWLLGVGEDADRPDRSKVIVNLVKRPRGYAVVLFEAIPGVTKTHRRARALLARFLSGLRAGARPEPETEALVGRLEEVSVRGVAGDRTVYPRLGPARSEPVSNQVTKRDVGPWQTTEPEEEGLAGR